MYLFTLFCGNLYILINVINFEFIIISSGKDCFKFQQNNVNNYIRFLTSQEHRLNAVLGRLLDFY